MVDWRKKELARIVEKIGDWPVVLYGAGKYGRQALENIRKYFPCMNIKYFIDDNRERNPEEGITSLQNAMEEFGTDFYIFITNYYVQEVLEKIERSGFDLSKVIFCSELLIEDINLDFLNENKEKLNKTYNMLEDYKSKIIYRTMIESRFTKNIDVLCRTCDMNQYFPDGRVWNIGDEEIFVDAGAFDGDTIEQFLNLTKERYQAIYAFEPDKTNYERMKKRKYNEKIKIYNAGLYDVSKKISFSANKGGSSKIERDGKERIQVYRFDELELPDGKVTFVKMDIEGSELKALQGMQRTIREHKPKLAICIYHKFEDLWQLPLFIKELVPEYRLYIRNYTTYLDEIVLYAAI